MKVSVVIPAYNEEGFLPRCLASLEEQEVPADEIIVVNNNSSDHTALLASKFNVTVIDEPEQGMIFARNAGFNAASGDIIARCDSDTMVPRNWIKRIKENFEVESVVAVTGPCYFYDLEMFKNKQEIPQKVHTALFFKNTRRIIGYDTLFGSNMALRASVWEKVKDEVCSNHKMVHEDMDITGHISKHGIIKFDPELLAAISSRRTRSVASMAEYSARWIKSLLHIKKIDAAD
jgi:glycosyltransferase involved in cell wall biosynthesis